MVRTPIMYSFITQIYQKSWKYALFSSLFFFKVCVHWEEAKNVCFLPENLLNIIIMQFDLLFFASVTSVAPKGSFPFNYMSEERDSLLFVAVGAHFYPSLIFIATSRHCDSHFLCIFINSTLYILLRLYCTKLWYHRLSLKSSIAFLLRMSKKFK